jgi:hypothetical protein
VLEVVGPFFEGLAVDSFFVGDDDFIESFDDLFLSGTKIRFLNLSFSLSFSLFLLFVVIDRCGFVGVLVVLGILMVVIGFVDNFVEFLDVLEGGVGFLVNFFATDFE